MEKAVILIDGGYYDYVNYYLKDGRSKKLSLEKFSEKLCDGKTHIRTKFYHANPYQSKVPTHAEKVRYAGAQKFQRMINKIKNHEFVPVGRVKPVHATCPSCKDEYTLPKQKGVDVAIALDLVKMAKKKVADVFILVSGDEDLASAVEMAQEELSNVIIYYCYDPPYNIYGSQKLNNVGSDRVQMDLDFLEECSL